MAFEPLPIITTIPYDDETSSAVATRALPQHVERVSFASAISNNVDSAWGSIIGSIGTGMTVNQTGGNLVITAGTTARSETIIRSNDSYEGGIRLRVRNTLSQRIANNNFFVELVDVIGDSLAYSISSATVMTVTFPAGHGFTSANVGQSMYLGGFSGTGTFLSGRYAIASIAGDVVTFTVSGFAAGTGTCSAFGWNYYQLQYQGTTATQVNFDTQRKGYASGATTATINTTASPGHLAVVTGNDLMATFADQLVASSTTIQQTVRATRAENVPDDFPLRIQIRVANGSTAPASGTTWTIGFVSISNYANQDVSVQDVRPMGIASGLPVEILRSASIAATISSGTVTTVTTVGSQTPVTPTAHFLNSAASTNATSVKATAGTVWSILVSNVGAAAAYLKIFNLSTAPTVGTSVPALTIPIPAGGVVPIDGGANGLRFSTGFSYCITNLAADTDTTAIAASQVKVFANYT